MPESRQALRTGRSGQGPGSTGGRVDRGRVSCLCRWGILYALLPAVVWLSASGCMRIPRERLDIRRYALVAPAIPEPPDTEYPGAAARATVLPVRVLLSPFTADARHRSERILFREDDDRFEHYYYHRWIVSPERMIGDLFASELAAWGICGEGLHRVDAGLIPTHEILGRVTGLYADNRKKHDAAVLEVELTVLRVDPVTIQKAVVFQKRYGVTEPRKNDRVDTFVPAANRAVRQWFIELRPDLEAALRTGGERTDR